MSKPNFRDELKKRVIVFDGAIGTMIYNKGIYINQCYELLNISRPELIKEIHKGYIDAGAEVIETNTFGATRLRLAKHGLDDKVRELNIAGVKIARDAAGDNIWVAGSVGPFEKPIEPYGQIKKDEALSNFKEQAEALRDGGVDLFILETFLNIDELVLAINAIKEVSNLPIIAQMTISDEMTTAYGDTPEDIVSRLEKTGVDVVGLNCSVGPVVLLEATKRMRIVSEIPLSMQPNAGLPQRVEGRLIYLATPEYLAEYAKRLIQSGANIVGACCGSTPAHIRAIKSAVKALQPVKELYLEVSSEEIKDKEKKTESLVEPPTNFYQKIKEGKFVISIEIDPPNGTNPTKAIEAAKICKLHNIDAVNIADGPRASARMSPLSLAVLFQREVGIEPILHYCCRDRNILGMQSDLLGAFSLGLHNILIITGDPPKLGAYPYATAVFDVDAIGLMRIVSNLNMGLDLAGNPIGAPTSFFAGVGVNPGAINFDEEIERFEKKVAAGAKYAMTQPVFDLRLFEKFIKRVEHCRIPLLVGILTLASSRNAEFLHNEVPGMQIPDSIRERIKNVSSGEGQKLEGIKIAQEQLKELAPMSQGTYIMPPFNKVESAIKVLEVLS